MKKRKYWGWIFAYKCPGFKDYIAVEWTDGEVRKHIPFGYGRAASAVQFFESTWSRDVNGNRVDGLNIGDVLLQGTPLGVRVYTEIEED